MSCYYNVKHDDYIQAKNSVLDTDLDRCGNLGWKSAAAAAKISYPILHGESFRRGSRQALCAG